MPTAGCGFAGLPREARPRTRQKNGAVIFVGHFRLSADGRIYTEVGAARRAIAGEGLPSCASRRFPWGSIVRGDGGFERPLTGEGLRPPRGDEFLRDREAEHCQKTPSPFFRLSTPFGSRSQTERGRSVEPWTQYRCRMAHSFESSFLS